MLKFWWKFHRRISSRFQTFSEHLNHFEVEYLSCGRNFSKSNNFQLSKRINFLVKVDNRFFSAKKLFSWFWTFYELFIHFLIFFCLIFKKIQLSKPIIFLERLKIIFFSILDIVRLRKFKKVKTCYNMQCSWHICQLCLRSIICLILKYVI